MIDLLGEGEYRACGEIWDLHNGHTLRIVRLGGEQRADMGNVG